MKASIGLTSLSTVCQNGLKEVRPMRIDMSLTVVRMKKNPRIKKAADQIADIISARMIPKVICPYARRVFTMFATITMVITAAMGEKSIRSVFKNDMRLKMLRYGSVTRLSSSWGLPKDAPENQVSRILTKMRSI